MVTSGEGEGGAIQREGVDSINYRVEDGLRDSLYNTRNMVDNFVITINRQ